MKIVDVDIIIIEQINKMLYNNHFLFFVIYTQVLADFDAVDN